MVFSYCQQMTEVFPPPSLFLHTQESGSAVRRTRFLLLKEPLGLPVDKELIAMDKKRTPR